MNYFINTWLVLIVALCVLLLLALTFLAIGWQNKLPLPETVRPSLPAVIYITAFALFIFFGWLSYNIFNDGKIQEFWVVEANGQARLCVRFAARLKSYGLDSGRYLGGLDLVKWRQVKHYQVFGPFGHQAWGYSKAGGLQLLDLAQPALLADEAKILKQNPRLHGQFRLIYGDNVYDPVKQAVQVIANDGGYFRINPDLSATALDDFTDYYLPKPDNWLFRPAQDGAGKILSRRGSRSSGQAAVLLAPQLIRELDQTTARLGKKVWVEHSTTLFGPYAVYLSYVDGQGRAITKLDLTKLFKSKKAKPMASLTRDKDVLIFISLDGYTLTALRVDRTTGKLLGRVRYFN